MTFVMYNTGKEIIQIINDGFEYKRSTQKPAPSQAHQRTLAVVVGNLIDWTMRGQLSLT